MKKKSLIFYRVCNSKQFIMLLGRAKLGFLREPDDFFSVGNPGNQGTGMVIITEYTVNQRKADTSNHLIIAEQCYLSHLGTIYIRHLLKITA